MDYVMALARDIVANAPIAVRKAKACINSCYDMDETGALAAREPCIFRMFCDRGSEDGYESLPL